MDVAWPGWASDVELVVAADSGARSARALGLRIDLVVGDGDSLGPAGVAELRAEGVAIELASVDKDESDTELAVRACLDRGATELTIVGAFGGRLDHALANIWLLALPELGGRRIILLDERTRVRLVRAEPAAPTWTAAPAAPATRQALPGRIGDTVSLLPLGGPVEGIVTEGLRYPLRDEPLVVGPSRGLSNVRESTEAAVTIRSGLLLVVESPATLTP